MLTVKLAFTRENLCPVVHSMFSKDEKQETSNSP